MLRRSKGTTEGEKQSDCCGRIVVTPAVWNGVRYMQVCAWRGNCVFNWKRCLLASLMPSLPQSCYSQSVCVCFCVYFLILPTHSSPLSTCVFVLYPLPSLHPTQPTKTTMCQPRFIILCSLFQSKILFFSSLSEPHRGHLHEHSSDIGLQKI